ncbi:hypothetical protein FKP32DRAFT_1672772 [Trametes sanguinea]|nr:hypothetical protein FKP32DRAFT_1672772 [Trametes sanguinea]
MSIVTVNRAIVPTLWPAGLGRPDTTSFSAQVDGSPLFVPETEDAMCDWAMVATDDVDDPHAQRWRRHLLYKTGEWEGETIVVVMQGYVAKQEIRVLGNWTGKEEDAARAKQTLTLVSGGCGVPFDAQRRSLADIRAFISAKVGQEVDRGAEALNEITLERDVFTKVRATDDRLSEQRVPLNEFNDPRGRARKIAARWYIDHVVETGMRRPNGENHPISADALRVGDFVEVSITANIRVLASRKRHGCVIRFAMEEVVRLWTREQANALFVRPDVEDIPKPGGVPRVTRRSVFGIGVRKTGAVLVSGEQGGEEVMDEK